VQVSLLRKKIPIVSSCRPGGVEPSGGFTAQNLAEASIPTLDFLDKTTYGSSPINKVLTKKIYSVIIQRRRSHFHVAVVISLWRKPVMYNALKRSLGKSSRELFDG
jgi:hypothetical protein